jgi:hypothetical protein
MEQEGERCFPGPYPVQSYGIFTAHCPSLGRRFTHNLGAKKHGRIRQRFEETSVNQKPADPSLNLEFVDEALNLVRLADAKGIRLRILASIAYRLHDSPTICTTDLLLEKMQIVKINLKDFKDTIVLMLEHPLSHEQPGPKSIDTDYIVDIMRQDWGFYFTFTTNLKRVPDYLDQFSSLGEEGRRVIRGRIEDLRAAIEAAPKSFGWKMRSKDRYTRSRWYQDVSETPATALP